MTYFLGYQEMDEIEKQFIESNFISFVLEWCKELIIKLFHYG
jgi:hypothetical protein